MIDFHLSPNKSKSHFPLLLVSHTPFIQMNVCHCNTWINALLPVPPGALQATRALMIVSIIVSVAGLGVACMGMKCTTCGGDDKIRKSRIAMTGGIILLIGCKELLKY